MESWKFSSKERKKSYVKIYDKESSIHQIGFITLYCFNHSMLLLISIVDSLGLIYKLNLIIEN